MIAVYDQPSNCYLLSYASSGSSENDRVIGVNIKSGEFFEWESVYYPVLTRYFDLGRKMTLVGDNSKGLGILDDKETTNFGDPISVDISTGVIFPLQNPKAIVNFTKVWLFAKPTLDTTTVSLTYWINGDKINTIDFDTEGGGTSFEGIDAVAIGSLKIGTDKIGKNKQEFIALEAELQGEGSSIQ